MYKFISRTFFTLLIFVFFSSNAQNLSQYVNPLVGTGGHGHTFPGAVMPFGMVQLSPDTRIDGSWDGCSGYHYSDKTIYGFSHTHLSGTGCSDWGDIMLMPMSTSPSLDKKVYSSLFTHLKEKASAGFYEVFLEDEKVKAELTVTQRTGIHRYSFPSNKGSVVLDLRHRDKLLKGEIQVIDSVTVIGYRISEAWAREQHCYFAMKFSEPIKKTSLKEGDVSAWFQFALKSKSLMIKVGISGVSTEGALLNLNSEASEWNFDAYKNAAQKTWDEQLSKITITENNATKKTIFYTALYHTSIHPSLNMDVDHQYRGRDNQIHEAKGFTNYSVFSLWDTYRALHPLFTITERKRSADFINTFIAQYQQGGRLPVWELSGNETDCMIGYHSVSVITDALKKGIEGFDKKEAFAAMKASASYSGFGVPEYCKKNYLSVEDEAESVSRTLEYAYDDWCIAQTALALGQKEDHDYFMKKAQSYKNVLDVKTGFMRPRKNGNWLSPFNPKEVNNYYTEGNSWQYSFYAPQDIIGLITLHGGRKAFETKLDSLFMTGSKTAGRDQADITGLIGQYAHGNEPSHHMAYLYNYIGEPAKTQALTWKILNEFYKNSPDGLIGNEDCGQMSAWFVLSSMGFYPVCPGSTEYAVSKPLFNAVELNLESGKKLTLTKSGNTGDNQIHSILSGTTTSYRSALDHSQLMEGGNITFSMTAKNDKDCKFGKGSANAPGSKITTTQLIAAPVIKSKSRSFEDKQEISIEGNGNEAYKIVYTTDGKNPAATSPVYSQPFSIENSCTVKCMAFLNDERSSVTEANFVKRPNSFEIKILSKYNPQYTAGGDKGIIDGIYGDVNWRKGEWQGYQNADFVCVVDMQKFVPVNSVALNTLQDTRSWIIFPAEVEVFISADNKVFTSIGEVKNATDAKDYTVQLQKFVVKSEKTVDARYVKIVAKNYGTLPAWHQGSGGKAFIFTDEIEIR